ncbi:hypothetical protein Tco_1205584, partial [Tanacetum coccineum]
IIIDSHLDITSDHKPGSAGKTSITPDSVHAGGSVHCFVLPVDRLLVPLLHQVDLRSNFENIFAPPTLLMIVLIPVAGSIVVPEFTIIAIVLCLLLLGRMAPILRRLSTCFLNESSIARVTCFSSRSSIVISGLMISSLQSSPFFF